MDFSLSNVIFFLPCSWCSHMSLSLLLHLLPSGNCQDYAFLMLALFFLNSTKIVLSFLLCTLRNYFINKTKNSEEGPQFAWQHMLFKRSLKFSVTLVVSGLLYQMIITPNISEPFNFYIKTEKLEKDLLTSVGDVIWEATK